MPLVLAAPELVVFIVLALLLVVLLVNVQLYQNGKQARSFAIGLPVVSGPVVSAIDWLIGFDIQAARVVDNVIASTLIAAVQGAGRLVVVAFNAAGAVVLALIHHTATTATEAHALATHLETVEVPRLGLRIVALEAEITALRNAETAALAAAVALLTARLEQEIAPIAQQAAATAAALAPFLPMLRRLAELPADAAAEITRALTLAASLAASQAVLAAQVATLEAGASVLERNVAAQQATIARLSALLVLAAAGALAIENLLRLGRDPCYCLTTGGFSDLPTRVEALENFGA